MNNSKRSLSWQKKFTFMAIYSIFLLLLIEAGSRAYWSATRRLYFFDPEIITHSFYPELKKIKKKEIKKDNGNFDILLLSGSALTKKHGNIRNILLEELTYKTRKEIKIFNLSVGAHTSLDSYYKYKRLLEKNFDLIMFYHAINDVRLNNCPPSFFESDYSHYLWYKAINDWERNNKLSFVTFPFTFYYLLLEAKRVLRINQIIPMGTTRPKLTMYGHDVKTSSSFKNNLVNILDIAKSKNEPVLLMTYAFFIPDGYTLEKFQHKNLDYTLHQGEIEIWGKPDNVVKGILSHNAVIEDLADSYNNTYLIDQNKLIPKTGRNFNDICHLTHKGSQKFVANILDTIIEIMGKKSGDYSGV